jgi:hypothetical protein
MQFQDRKKGILSNCCKWMFQDCSTAGAFTRSAPKRVIPGSLLSPPSQSGAALLALLEGLSSAFRLGQFEFLIGKFKQEMKMLFLLKCEREHLFFVE